MSSYIVDWDGRLVEVEHLRELSLRQWKKFFEFTGSIRVQNILRPCCLDDQDFAISSIELGQEIVLDAPNLLWWRHHYVFPEECRVRADRAYQSLRSSMPAEIDRQIYKYVDVLSLGSIMNGVVI